jgi:hypothetical protein
MQIPADGHRRGRREKMSKTKEKIQELMSRVMEITGSTLEEKKDFKTLLLDQLLDKIPTQEKIDLITGFLKNPKYQFNAKKIEPLLLALEFLFKDDLMGDSSDEGMIAFRAHLIKLYNEREKGIAWPRYVSEKSINDLELKILERILKGWSWQIKYEEGNPQPIRSMQKDAKSCFSFVCEAYSQNKKEHFNSEFQKGIEDIFRASADNNWDFIELGPWILRAPEGIAVLLLKQRTRLAGESLIPELRLLENFSIHYRSDEAIAFIAEKMKTVRETEECAGGMVEKLESLRIKGVKTIESSFLSEDTVLIHAVLVKTAKMAPLDGYRDLGEYIKQETKKIHKETGKFYKFLLRVTGPGIDCHDPELDSKK